MPDRYDVVIVGARCAGASLAAFLARQGARVAVLDRDALPSDYVLSTHTVHPAGMDVLDELGVGARVRAGSPPMRVVRLYMDGAAVDVRLPVDRCEYCPRRFRLDAVLQEAAAEAGAELRDRTRVVGLLHEGGRVAGVRVRAGGAESELRADRVVGADGRRSAVAEMAGAREYLGYDGPRGMYWAYWPAPERWKDPGEYPFDMYLAHAGEHVRVIFQTDDDQLLLGTLPPLEAARRWRSDLPAAYSADLASDPVMGPLVRDNAPAGEIRGTLRDRYFFREAFGPGWALVGDAGHYKEYVIGDGITEALRQARGLAAALADGGDEALARWWRRRDLEGIPLFRFGQDQGDVGPQPRLRHHVLRRLAHLPELAGRMMDPFDRTVSPYDTVPPAVVLRALAGGLLRGEWRLLPEMAALGRRAAAVKQEVAGRDRLVADLRASPPPPA
ncbi:MAG TPA: NAD(P)/FAD-dependent oxidoreductase [Longimicrobiaceae bacterium]|nr:NAD(P)/FAD-dependent oxidoreductase [Longimicrobiaceae bacterium]